MKVVDPAVNGKWLATLPGLDNGWEASKDTDLIYYVELAKTLPTHTIVIKQGQLLHMCLSERTNWGYPSFEWVCRWRPESSLNSPTTIMTSHNDVGDLE